MGDCKRASRPGGLYSSEWEHDACGVGFVAHIKGEKSRQIVEGGLEILHRLRHRGAAGADPDTGDGAGILLQIPHRFFKAEGLRLGFDMPRRRRYAIGMVFLPSDRQARAVCEQIFEETIAEEGQRLLGWRDVPVDPQHVGSTARNVMPTIRQVYIARRRLVPSAFERKLYVIRKRVENRIRDLGIDPDNRFHVASLSADTIVYKGLLLPHQLPRFYRDLNETELVSAIALVHSRFSTNTFPTWDLAQPMRYVAHNGEINTVRGNRNWMNARRSLLESAKFFGPIDRLFPIIVPGKSDSAQLDNMLELLHIGGRSLPHSLMMMIPEAWEGHQHMDPERKAFYRYSGHLMEPWDGPAALAFTDGKLIGATLDRNGLRPARYLITNDNRVILASESGVADVPASQVRYKGRLRPGRMFLVDTASGRIIDDEEIKRNIACRWPYDRWLDENEFFLTNFPEPTPPPRLTGDELRRLQIASGFSSEDVDTVLAPMAASGKEPTGSMGTDTPLAVLSDCAPKLYQYFHQLFAQVTNPPIDPIREALVTSVDTTIGPDGNTFEETPDQCHSLSISGPIITNAELTQILSVHEGVFEPTSLSTLYDINDDGDALGHAVDRLCKSAHEAVDEGYNLLILSDRGVNADRAAIPSLLALSAVHQHLVRIGTRMQCGLVVESADACSVHEFALLIGYGAAAVNPYLALDSVVDLAEAGALEGVDADKAVSNYIEAIKAGLIKIMSKMGISTVASYRGAQIFEAVGLERALIQRHLTDTPSRIGGIGLEHINREVATRHRAAFAPDAPEPAVLPVGGYHQWRRRGERHRWNPATVAMLQQACRRNDPAQFAGFVKLANQETDSAPMTLRDLLTFACESQDAIDVSEVESAEVLVKRFVTGAMSFGSISAEAHETLAIAMNRLGARSNSGEGGEEERRFEPDPNGDLRRSAVKQVASGRFGVTSNYLVNADEIQIKIAQGAKPGEGGQLPGYKVDERIARVRCSTPGVTLISPPPHHDIYSIEDLAQLIHDLQAANPEARISVKLVSEVGVGTVAAGVAKAGAGAIVVAGFDGGTGASAISSIRHAGLPWELGLAETQQVLVQNNLRGRVRLQVDGGLRTGRDVVVAALLGAEEFGIATAALIVTGCVMLRKCHLNTCSVGVATQDPELRKRFTGTPEHVINFFMLLAEDIRQHMARLGFRTFDEMVGRTDKLKPREVAHWKASTLNLRPLLDGPEVPHEWPRKCARGHRNPLTDHIDRLLLRRSQSVFDGGEPVRIETQVHNTDRSVGAMLSGEVSRAFGAAGLPDDSIHIKLLGTAGQSFGAFLAPGVTLELEGDANDYVGKGLSGGRVVVYPPGESTFAPDKNVLIGNTVLYGATRGEAYFSGVAGERFAVRNSGARAVVEGVGDHGCEYMTGGVVVCLGATGRNFAAGMSGGVAYVFEREKTFRERCNLSMVELESLSDESEIWLVYGMIEAHVRHTGSPLGNRILDNWEMTVDHFVKVMPIEYKRVLAERRKRRSRTTRPNLTVVRGGAR